MAVESTERKNAGGTRVDLKRERMPRGRSKPATGLTIKRVFSRAGEDPYEQVQWERRTASITDDKGAVIFRQEDVEAPTTWSMLATNVVASKYFYGPQRSPEREYSVRQLVHRVARTITDWGIEDGLFAGEEDAAAYYDELATLCLQQYGSFNSPVWFNCGLYHQYQVGLDNNPGGFYWNPQTENIARAATQYEYPQCSACFIQSVNDTMEGIMELARSEAMLFKYGSGTGTDLTPLRSQRERLSGGGVPSGPLSFLRVYDAIAGVVKSGGKTRRAAKMNTLKCRHPDIKEFIQAKQEEERKAWALIEEGYDGSFNGEAYASVAYQNENLSIRITDEFMQAVARDEEWQTYWVTDASKKGPCYKARDLLRWIGEGAWICGDPGLQFEDTIQRWHTCKHTGPINASNPCSEYMFLDDSACNLASLNLMKFMEPGRPFDAERFAAAVRIFITAQELIVDHASYPTEGIAASSHRFRPLGLGYANLGCLLMSLGLPYDSEAGRALASTLTAIMHFNAYAHSAELSQILGPFDGFAENRECMIEVIEQHVAALDAIPKNCPEALSVAAREAAERALEQGRRHGYRNAQVTVLAPTGTIGFMMDCDTTGVEPDIALVKYKALAGGGMLKLVNRSVAQSLRHLGYNEADIKDILAFIDEHDTIEGAPKLHEGDLPVFDCAFKPQNGKRFISYLAHVRMMAAVQPFLSGAISKTVNMPNEATIEQIIETYQLAWEQGLKALAVYRDGCKRSQPLNTARQKKAETGSAPATGGNGSKARPLRRRMPSTRRSITHKFDIAGHEGYLTVGLYEEGLPGELFITMAKEGSTIGGLMDSFGTAISLCLQYGVPLQTLVEKFAHTRFEPSGFTKDPNIPIAKSLVDYIFRWMGHTFQQPPRAAETQKIEPAAAAAAPVAGVAEAPVGAAPASAVKAPVRIDEQFKGFMEDAPICDSCGAITVRNGACYRCYNCGNSMGCS
ncbi:MAG: vitamin B12-dependent ribonucleotide reductase [Candidatus Marinimicrobia bacterium]|nr:vitamin B12-dependent ribonucleotide reductase [Candidatus Neomarinimicrobiota bacterium]